MQHALLLERYFCLSNISESITETMLKEARQTIQKAYPKEYRFTHGKGIALLHQSIGTPHSLLFQIAYSFCSEDKPVLFITSKKETEQLFCNANLEELDQQVLQKLTIKYLETENQVKEFLSYLHFLYPHRNLIPRCIIIENFSNYFASTTMLMNGSTFTINASNLYHTLGMLQETTQYFSEVLQDEECIYLFSDLTSQEVSYERRVPVILSIQQQETEQQMQETQYTLSINKVNGMKDTSGMQCHYRIMDSKIMELQAIEFSML